MDMTWHQLWEQLPKWQCVPDRTIGAYNVFWNYPPGFKDVIMPKVFQCPKLLEIIVERFQQVLNSGQFDIDEITLLVRPTGFHISVPGNACGIDPDHIGNSMCGHNIDSPAQAFSLCFLLLTMLGEIYSIASIWDNNTDVGIEITEKKEKCLTIIRSRESKPFAMWSVTDFDGNMCGYVSARDWEEARETANLFFTEQYQRVQPHWTTEPRPFMPTERCKYTVLVFLINGEMQTKTIEAYSSESATTQARELFDIDSIYDVRVKSCKEI